MMDIKKGKSPLIEVSHRDLMVMMEAGYIYLQMRKYQESLDVFSGVGTLAPSSEIPHLAMGNVYSTQGQYEKAYREHSMAAELDPNNALVRALLGEVLLFKKRKDEALLQLGKAIELDSEGASGNFAKSLLKALDEGLLPPK